MNNDCHKIIGKENTLNGEKSPKDCQNGKI